MYNEIFDYDISELEQLQEVELENNIKVTVNKLDGHYLFDENEKKILDLTSNNDCLPLEFSSETVNLSGFYETSSISSSNAKKLRNLIREVSGYENSEFFPEKLSAYNFIKKIINKKPQNRVLVSSLDTNNWHFPDKEVINITLNDESAVKNFLNKHTEAVIVEISQVKDSLTIAEADYLAILREFCDKNNAVLVYDVSQISPLRFNKGLFNIENFAKPDVIISSRGLTAGISLYIVSHNLNSSENPECGVFSAAYAQAIEFIKNQGSYKPLITENSEYLQNKFAELAEVHIGIADFISCGMMFAVVTEIPAEKLAKAALNKGILLKPLNEYSVLLYPPYNITKLEIDRVIEAFGEIFNELTPHDRLIP